MDSEEDQARLHFRTPPNTFGICWEPGGKNSRGSPEGKVSDCGRSCNCVFGYLRHTPIHYTKNIDTKSLVTQRLGSQMHIVRNALIEFPWLRRTCTVRSALEQFKFGTSGHGDFHAEIHC